MKPTSAESALLACLSRSNKRTGWQARFSAKKYYRKRSESLMSAFADFFAETCKRSADLAGQTGRDISLLWHKPMRDNEIQKVFAELLVPLAGKIGLDRRILLRLIEMGTMNVLRRNDVSSRYWSLV